MDAIIIQNAAGDERLVTEDLDQLLPALAPVAEALDCTAEVQNVRDIVDRGASYQRQLRVADANDGSLKAVVASLVRELRDGQPD
jgi:glutamate---cysteine ligase / carboxylate-amine ligase